ncbi:MAG: radical SAM protein [Deltaproteobacteria bacterium]|nr:radical SAM protein [Deltaproteobacteria bacterium]
MKSIYFLSLNMIPFVPYNYGVLRSYVEQNGIIAENYQWQEPIWAFEPTKDIVEKVKDPDILCASCYIWNHNNHSEVAKRVKEKYPRCNIIFGGPQIPEMSDGYFNERPYVDVLVHGEGEIPLEHLLIALLNDQPDLSRIPGISFSQDGQTLKNPCGPTLPKDLPIPSPYLSGHFDHVLGNGQSNGHSNVIGAIETNRGCPFSCAFCDWGVNSMNQIRRHDLDKVFQEIRFIGKHRIKELHISDPNFGILKRDLDIARMLVETKKTYGYPQTVRTNYAKHSNDRVFRISKLLFDHGMSWSTTISVQSLDKKVLKAINRKNIPIEEFKKLKDRYNEHGIPTYTEIILGLPLQTRDSFIDGMCQLLELGSHDDIRLFQLSMLPNAPLSQKAFREKYDFKTRWKPLRMVDEKQVREDVELVFGTNALSYEDWLFCTQFAEMIQSLHNGGYTRFLSRYLNDEHILSYKDFYTHLLNFMLKSDAAAFRGFRRVRKLLNDYYENPDIPETPKILDQPDIMAFLNTYNPRRKGWRLYVYLWLTVSENIEGFYDELGRYLKDQGIPSDHKIRDLLRYQQDIMITLDYDPEKGKTVSTNYNWFGYFFNNEKPLQKGDYTLHYADTHMGPGHRYELVKNDRRQFLIATNGYAYPYSRFRLFFHQPDAAKVRSNGVLE